MNSSENLRASLALLHACGPCSLLAGMLLTYAGSAARLWEQEAFSVAFHLGIAHKKLRWLEKPAPWFEKADRTWEAMDARGKTIVSYGDEAYPERLGELSCVPLVLFCDGDTSLLKADAVAAVGTRKPTPGGMTIARFLGRLGASNQRVLVSGAAAGIDGAVHRGTLAEDGKTIAVLGTPIEGRYPWENRALIDRIAAEGLVVSEYPPEMPVRGYHFAQRNRIIAGLAEHTVVIQAPKGSGALITAEYALEQGASVYACPWPEDMLEGHGCLQLLADGAIPLVKGDEIPGMASLASGRGLQEYLHSPPENSVRLAALAPVERQIFSILSWEKRSLEDLARMTARPLPAVSAALMALELKGLAMSWFGNVYTRASL